MKEKTNVHPGEILQLEFLVPLKITAYKLSKAISMQQIGISLIINGKRGITTDTAIRFSKFFGTTPQFWLNLQREYDLRKTLMEKTEIFESIQPLSLSDSPPL